jgi:hypothetical protein
MMEKSSRCWSKWKDKFLFWERFWSCHLELVYPKKGHCRGKFQSLDMKMLSVIPVLPSFQGGSRVTAERMVQSKDRYKIEDRCHAFLLLLVNSRV